MRNIGINKLRETPLNTVPFEHVIIPGFISKEGIKRVNASFPPINRGGSYPVENLSGDMAVSEVIEELNGVEFEQAVAEKFHVDLTGRPKMFSLRGYTRAKDGSIHTDSRDKIITVLLYLNEDWGHQGGRLRLLRSGTDIEDFATEIPPDNGTLLIFKRSEKSWHGHLPFEGPRRSLQMNWMVDGGKKFSHVMRHKLSHLVKRATAGLGH